MNEQYTINYTRTKDEAKSILFNKEFKKSFWIGIIRAVIILPGCFILAFLSIAAFSVALNTKIESSLAYIFTALLGTALLIPFVKPLIDVYRFRKNYLKELYKGKKSISTICMIDDINIIIKSDSFEYNTIWENTKLLQIGNIYIQFQTIAPSLQFVFPRDKLSDEALNLLKNKISIK